MSSEDTNKNPTDDDWAKLRKAALNREKHRYNNYYRILGTATTLDPGYITHHGVGTLPNRTMSTQTFSIDETDDEQNYQPPLSQLLPLTSAADAGRENRVRVQFDQHIADMLKYHARHRALNGSKYPDRDVRNHLLGFASEVAVATMLNGSVDTRVLDDFAGDGGVDVTTESTWEPGLDRIQVKATRELNDPERVIDRDEISNVDFVLLCCSDVPERRIEIVGYTSRTVLQRLDDTHGRSGPLLREEILEPLSGRLYLPNDVREVVGTQP